MSSEEVLRSINALIAAITAFLIALASFYKARSTYLRSFPHTRETTPTQSGEGGGKEDERHSIREVRVPLLWTAGGGFLLGTAATLFVLWLFRAPLAPKIAITQPLSASAVPVRLIETGSARFDIVGSSHGVFGNTERRIYILVHPEEPSAAGWWIQPDVALEPSGRWSGVAWIGNAQSQARTTDRLLMMAIVAPNIDPVPIGLDGVPWVRNPDVLRPVATATVRVAIGEVRSAPHQRGTS